MVLKGAASAFPGILLEMQIPCHTPCLLVIWWQATEFGYHCSSLIGQNLLLFLFLPLCYISLLVPVTLFPHGFTLWVSSDCPVEGANPGQWEVCWQTFNNRFGGRRTGWIADHGLCVVNRPTMAAFKLLIWCYWNWSEEEMGRIALESWCELASTPYGKVYIIL